MKKNPIGLFFLMALPAVLVLGTKPQDNGRETTQAFLNEHCASCHDQKSYTGGFVLDGTELGRIGQNRGIWEIAVRRLRSGVEPPVSMGRPKPDAATTRLVVSWLEAELDRNAPDHLPPPGLHRLNRTEYGNAIRDVAGMNIDPTTLLPPDDSTRGFDNIASALTVSAAHAEAYSAAAAKISALAMTTPDAAGTIFVCRPNAPEDEAACAQRILTTLARKAFRRPPGSEDLNALMEIYRTARAGASFERGIEAALERILRDPQFIYRAEPEPANIAVGQSYPITDFELASRLSHFLWSRGPDDRLIDVASRGELQDPAVLENETRRMLQDPRAEALALNFAGQWLSLRWLQNLPMEGALRDALRREAEMLFDSIVREDRSIVDLLTADYTFVNERLAQHYGIPNVSGNEFRRVALGPELDARRGLLGKGAILAATSRADRTSVVTRGYWIMTNLLGVSPPSPPPNVPPLGPGGGGQTFRQTMLDHRIREDCFYCHRLTDPIGFALENFTRTGIWRSQENGMTIDASGELMDGTKINGPADLRNTLVGYSDQFVQTFVQKLFIYALGRGIDYHDMPAIRAITKEAELQDNRFSAIVLAIVKSKPFRMNAKQ